MVIFLPTRILELYANKTPSMLTEQDAYCVLRIFHQNFVRCSDSTLNEAPHWSGRTGRSAKPELERKFDCGCGRKCYVTPYTDVVAAISAVDPGLCARVCVRKDTKSVVAILKYFGIWTTPFRLKKDLVDKIRARIGQGLVDADSPWRPPQQGGNAQVPVGSIVGYRSRQPPVTNEAEVQQLVADAAASGRPKPWAAWSWAPRPRGPCPPSSQRPAQF